ncbi:protein adenylyltransferase FICD-like [Gigantopelta aegis]|uniref:protein adenylyltransferase FICD-like n=1 Tax=Gigantopelta aegis TaxID=1735272 RepID=UPI001B88A3AF|nr:protein adenylyltransferase FICD-like [Gigantopelta aegis]
MADWIPNCSNSPVFLIFKKHKKYKRPYNQSYSPFVMSRTVFIIIVLTSVVVAYVASYFPGLLVILYPNRLSWAKTYSFPSHETSLVLRPKAKVIISKDVKREAVAALNIALDLQEQGKSERAQKVFQHALSLDPSHADILTAFGEFIEIFEKDVIKADHMYRRALSENPSHSKALENIQRTRPLVEEIDQKRFNRIDNKRDQLYQVPPNHPGLRRAKKEAYFLHIFHTNAIEGNTLTLAQTRSIVETRIAVGGKSLAEQNEVLGLDSALSYINSTLLGKVGHLHLNDILEIHKRVLGHVDPTEAGQIRKTQVFVGDFQPPSPAQVNGFMNQFIDWLNSDEALDMHPIEYAALAHYKLVIIHPFYDGNGRTSRLLMNLILMQAGFPPVSVQVGERSRYYETLNKANAGDLHPFIHFIAECTERTLDEFLLYTSENLSTSVEYISKVTERIISETSERVISMESP